jgi:hypothetical protein
MVPTRQLGRLTKCFWTLSDPTPEAPRWTLPARRDRSALKVELPPEGLFAGRLLLGWNNRNSGITAGASLRSREEGSLDELLHDLFDPFLAEPFR